MVLLMTLTNYLCTCARSARKLSRFIEFRGNHESFVLRNFCLRYSYVAAMCIIAVLSASYIHVLVSICLYYLVLYRTCSSKMFN